MELYEIIVVIIAAMAGMVAAWWEIRERKNDHEERAQARLDLAITTERTNAEIEKIWVRLEMMERMLLRPDASDNASE